MKISVFGLGYVGCVTSACLARDGHEVWGVDANPEKAALVGAGKSPIVEPGLSELLAAVFPCASITGAQSPGSTTTASLPS